MSNPPWFDNDGETLATNAFMESQVVPSMAVMQEAKHLITLCGTEWALWDWVCLRSAGFPAAGIFKLAATPDLISAADEVIHATQAMELAGEKALLEIRSALDELRANGQWHDTKKRKALLAGITRIKTKKVPLIPEIVSPEVFEQFRAAIERTDTARVAFHQRFSRNSAKTSDTIREIARSNRFCEALTWQNRSAVRTALDPLLQNPQNEAARNSAQRQHEELVASYWQRYCVKNDTIGFFGPVGWVSLAPDDDHLFIRHGQQLVTARKTYWESWAMETLGAALTRKYNLEPWIVPFLVPFARIEGTLLHHPVIGSISISAEQAALLQACNGRDTAKQVAFRLKHLPESQFEAESEVYAKLHELSDRGLVFWKFHIPHAPHSEEAFREALQRIEDPNLRKPCLDLLDKMDAARAQVEASAGDANKLNLAFEQLEHLFLENTGVSATHGLGKTYAGRTLVYEDCRRDIEVQLGTKLLEPLIEPLSLLLLSSRWFTVRVAEIYRKKLVDIYSELARATGNSIVDAALCWLQARPCFEEESAALMAPLEEEFRGKWERILQIGPSTGPMTYSWQELHECVLHEFPATHAGWLNARYHSPDVMIAAASEEAIRQGDYFFVLGEVHVGGNTLQAALFVNQHPSPKDLIDATENDLGAFNVVPVGPKPEGRGSRMVQWLIPKSNLRLEYLPDLFATDRSQALPISSMVVESHNGELIARTRDGKHRFDVIDLVGGMLTPLVIDCFRIIARRRHTPRISIGRLVVKRESWHFSPPELEFAACQDPAERFLQARIWAQAEGLPRFVFFKVPVEEKPSFLDFESPILLDIFARMIRRTLDAKLPDATIDLSEMLPTKDQIWLTDAQNQRYTAEFRFVAVDSQIPKAHGR